MTTSLLLSLFLATAAARAGDDDVDAASALDSGRFAEIAAELELTDAQRKAVSDAMYTANTARVDIEARGEKARIELRHQLAADTVDEKAVLKAVDTLNAAESDLRKNRVQLVLTLRKTLSPEQWRELLLLRQERREDRRMMGHDNAGGPGMGGPGVGGPPGR